MSNEHCKRKRLWGSEVGAGKHALLEDGRDLKRRPALNENGNTETQERERGDVEQAADGAARVRAARLDGHGCVWSVESV